MPGLKESGTVEIEPDELVELVGQNSERGTVVAGYGDGGRVFLGKHRATAERGVRRVTAGERAEIEIRRDGEQVFAYNPDSTTATLFVVESGFLLRILGIDPKVPRDSNQFRRQAISTVEPDADQTVTVGPNQTGTTTVSADASKSWVLKKALVEWDGLNAAGEYVPHEVTASTETQGIEVLHMDDDEANAAGTKYRSGTLVTSDGAADRDDLVDTRVDDDSGIDFEYRNEIGDGAGLEQFDDAEDGDIQGWSGDTGSLTNQTGTVLTGDRTLELNSGGTTQQVNRSTDGSEPTWFAFTIQIDTQTGDASDNFDVRISSTDGTFTLSWRGDGTVGSLLPGGGWSAGSAERVYGRIDQDADTIDVFRNAASNLGGALTTGTNFSGFATWEWVNSPTGSSSTVNVYVDATTTAALSIDQRRTIAFQAEATSI